MALSPTDTQTALEMLADIRRKQNKAIDAMRDDWRQFMQFDTELGDLAGAVAEFGCDLPAQPTSQQAVGISRDIKEFKADVSGLRQYVAQIANVARDVNAYMVDIKSTLDIIQTRFEESDV